MTTMRAMAKSLRRQDVAARLWRNIESLLEFKQISRNQLGQQTGINNGGVQRLERGDSVGYQLIEKVAQHYGYTAADLLDPHFDPAAPRRKPDEYLQVIMSCWPQLTDRQRRRMAELIEDLRQENSERKSGAS